MQDLLKEAIADAKAIRQVAIENAKASLAETFAPRIKKMVAEEMNNDDDSLYEEDEYTDEEDSLDETLFEMEDEDMMEGDSMEDDEMMEGDDMETDYDEPEDTEDDYEESDELDEILRELDMEEEDPMMEEEDMEEPKATPAPKEAPVMKTPSEPSKKSELEEFIREMLAEMEGSEEEEPSADMEAMKEELDSKEEELQEAYRTIKFLKKKINESLLINSKLLYSGKLFRAHNLDESQKVSILESFDRATSIRETKLLYASLATTLNEIKSKANSKSIRLKESRASKSTLNSTKPSPKVLEENKMVSRLQQLAGIIK